MKKRMVCVLLAGIMASALLAGCSGTVSENEMTDMDSGSSEEGADATASFEGFDTMQTIDMYGMSFYGDDGLAEVMEAINEISEKEINVHVNYTSLDISSYIQQIGLMLAGGESFDLTLCTSISSVSFSTMAAQNELMDITDYLDEYAPELMEKMGNYLEATTLDGSIYAVPCYRQYNSSLYIVMRKDILDYLGLTEQASAIESWSDYEEIMAAVYEAQDELPEDMQVSSIICNSDSQGTVISSGYCNVGADSFAENYGFDGLGDTNKIIYVDESGQVSNYFASDDYRAAVERVHDWYQKGYVYKDASTAQDGADANMMNDITFSYVVQAEYGAEETKEMATGKELVMVKILDIPIQTANGAAWAWAVPTTSDNPEAAVAFLNLMYNNADIENLFVYGIEGRDYEVNEEGEAVVLADALYQCSDFFFGDQFLAYPNTGSGESFREDALEDMNNAEISPYYGCVVNTEPIANELTALNSVLNKYEAGLESGVSDPDLIDTMLEEMEASGLQTVLDYYQETLDTWLAGQ